MVIIFVIPLAVLRAGVWQQERAASLASRPRGLSAVIARHVFGLHAILPESTVDPFTWPYPDAESSLAPNEDESAIT